MELWYNNPANNWNEALPIGNGFLGGMIFGGTQRERVQLNEDSLWYGSKPDRNNPDSLKYLGEIRKLLSEGKISEAESLTEKAMFALPAGQSFYQTMGDLFIDFKTEEVTEYRRRLDISSAIASVEYKDGNTLHTREYFASNPHNLIIIKIEAKEKVSFSINYKRSYFDFTSRKHAGNNIVITTGKTGGEIPIEFSMAHQVFAKGGNITTIGSSTVVENADSAYIAITARTSFRDNDPTGYCLDRLGEFAKAFESEGYLKIRQRHEADFKKYMDRVNIELGEDSPLPTDQRLDQLKNGASDNNLFALYFQFGRYLLISSSRENSLPANLQGIWNEAIIPPWGSKYTVNINTEMNYWHAEICNLPELHQPLFDHIERMRPRGRITANTMYGCRGFTSHHNTDIFGDCAPQDQYMPASIWPMSSAWLCLHIYEHYLFTGDKKFLEEKFDTLKEAALFFVDYLTENKNGELVTGPSVSPENTYVLPNGERGRLCMGPSMDSQILYGLFTSVIEASETLDKDRDFAGEIEALRNRLPKPSIGRNGQIMEWAEDYDEAEPGHRHISHLFALYPGDQISSRRNKDLANGARTTLENRLKHGGGHTGWSRAWIINFWARLLDGEKAYENLKLLLVKSTLINLLDNHPPFQIDGNFGGTAGIAEMLLQSHSKQIWILPALPTEWQNGSIEGLVARGCYEFSFTWENQLLKKISFTSPIHSTCTVNIPAKHNETGKDMQVELKNGKGLSL